MLNDLKPILLITAVSIISACTQLTKAPETDSLALAKAIHEKALVLDAHADIEILGRPSPYVGADGLSKVEPAKMRTGRFDAVVMAIAVGPGPRDSAGYEAARKIADEKLAAIMELTSDPNDDVVLVRSARDLEQAHGANQRALVLGFQNARILGKDISAIDEFYNAGVRVFALTHMGHNDFADSSRPVFSAAAGKHEANEEHGGLSKLGRQAVDPVQQTRRDCRCFSTIKSCNPRSHCAFEQASYRQSLQRPSALRRKS